MFKTILRVRVETFFKDYLRPEGINSNVCRFKKVKDYNDGTHDVQFLSKDEEIIKKVEELYESYDYTVVPKTELEQELEYLSNENKVLGQMITDLELAIIEIQMSSKGSAKNV